MIGIDTNVLVRFLADDDIVRHNQAKRFLTARSAEDPAFVSGVTLAETVWVLHRRLKFPISDIVAVIRNLLASDGIVMEHAEELGQLLHGDRQPETDIADYLIAWSASAAGCSHTVTLHRQAAKSVPGMELLA